MESREHFTKRHEDMTIVDMENETLKVNEIEMHCPPNDSGKVNMMDFIESLSDKDIDRLQRAICVENLHRNYNDWIGNEIRRQMSKKSNPEPDFAEKNPKTFEHLIDYVIEDLAIRSFYNPELYDDATEGVPVVEDFVMYAIESYEYGEIDNLDHPEDGDPEL